MNSFNVLKYDLNNKSIVNFNENQVIKPITNFNYANSVFNQTVFTTFLTITYQIL